MSEVKDLVMPMLKGIQGKLTGVESKLNEVAATTQKTAEKVEELEGLITFHLGLTTGHTSDIQA